MSNSNHHEEDLPAKIYDAAIARRLLGYLRPYRGTVLTALTLTIGLSLVRQIGPLLTKLAIDWYVAPAAGQLLTIEAATAGVKIQCSQAQQPSLTAHVPALSREYVLHRGLIWLVDADSGDLVHPSAYVVSQGVVRWRNEAIGFAVRPFRPRHEIHLASMQEYADGNQLTGPFPCKLVRGSIQNLS